MDRGVIPICGRGGAISFGAPSSVRTPVYAEREWRFHSDLLTPNSNSVRACFLNCSAPCAQSLVLGDLRGATDVP